MFEKMHEQHLAAGNPPFESKTIPQGAATTVWAAVVADAGEIGGRYCEDCHVATVLADDEQVSPLRPALTIRGVAMARVRTASVISGNMARC